MPTIRYTCLLAIAVAGGCDRLFALSAVDPARGDALDDAPPVDALTVDAVELCVGFLTAGRDHTCARGSVTGEVACWGLNDFNQLGATTASCGAAACSRLPITNADLGIVSQVAAGEATTCGWTAGAGSCVGQFPGMFTGVGVEFTVGDVVICGRGEGVVRCAGQNSVGQLGQGSTTPSFSGTWLGVSLPAAAIEVTTGKAFGCALLQNGDVYCWGQQSWGVIGTAASPATCANGDPCEPTPTKIPLAAPALGIDAGQDFACARDALGVSCWGRGDRGQLGVDAATLPSCSAGPCSYTPMRVLMTPGVEQVSAGGLHACARHTNGDVVCWGENTNGQFGDGTTAGRGPSVATAFAGASSLAAGGNHTCALIPPGRVLCAGANNNGQLGNGTLMGTPTPTEALRCQ
jgi:alpha-tubulin suppressor-like RCC1 family protein